MDSLAEILGAPVVGEGSRELVGLSSLADAGPDEISFFSDSRYQKALENTRAGALITKEPLDAVDVPQIIHPDPFLAFVELADVFFPQKPVDAGVHPLASVSTSAVIADDAAVAPFVFIGDDAVVGSGTILHPGAYLGANSRVGADCVVWPRVVIRDGCRLGSRVIVHPGAVIGADGFGFARRDGKFIKVRHLGSVDIRDDVEIGANATVDRGTLGNTVIHTGVKIDNLVHVAHNVEVGEHSALAAQTGISGSTVIGKRVLMGGQTGIVDHLSVGDDAILIAQSGVIGNVPQGSTLSGFPARPHKEVLKSTAELRAMSRLRRKINELEARIVELEADK